MAIPDNKARVIVTMEKDLVNYLKERSTKNKRTVSNEIATIIEMLKNNESKE